MAETQAVPVRDQPPHQEAAAGPDPQILARLKSVEGHVRCIHRMVEQDAYCVDVVHQILAVQKALKKISAKVLDRHLHHCATAAIRGSDARERERVLGELLDLFDAAGRT
jgi:CsoR family transcriptional regulator, copper-sensing transcriptional repressor